MYPRDPNGGQQNQYSNFGQNNYQGYYQPPRKSNTFTIIAFVFAVAGLVLFWIPIIGLLLAVAGLILSIIALGSHQLKGMTISGICISAVGLVLSLLLTIGFVVGAMSGASDGSDVSVASSEAPSASASSASASAKPETTLSPSSSSSAVPKNPDLATFHEVDDRQLAQIVKDPKGHVGEQLIVYGWVTQLDSATGACGMRVNVGASYQPETYLYETNTIAFDAESLNGKGKCSSLEPLVKDDNVKLWVTVAGAETYGNTIGGSTTAPVVAVYKAEIQ